MATTKKAATEAAVEAESAVKAAVANAKEDIKEAELETSVKADRKVSSRKTASKKASAKKTTTKKENIILQFAGKEIDIDSIVCSSRADFKANNKGSVRSLNIYIKPEDEAAYYVVNGKTTGRVQL